MHDDPNLQSLEATARALEPSLGDVGFLGNRPIRLSTPPPAVRRRLVLRLTTTSR